MKQVNSAKSEKKKCQCYKHQLCHNELFNSDVLVNNSLCFLKMAS